MSCVHRNIINSSVTVLAERATFQNKHQDYIVYGMSHVYTSLGPDRGRVQSGPEGLVAREGIRQLNYAWQTWIKFQL